MPLIVSTLVGTGLGLAISALSSSRDQAATIVPLAVVPQLTLGMGIIPILPELAQSVRDVTISVYWTIEAMKAAFIAADGPVQTFPPASGRVGTLASKGSGDAMAMLCLHAVVLLAVSYAVTVIRFGREKG